MLHILTTVNLALFYQTKLWLIQNDTDRSECVLECTVRLKGGHHVSSERSLEKKKLKTGSFSGRLAVSRDGYIWSVVEHQIFAMEMFLRNNELIVAMISAFCRHFNIPPLGSVDKQDRKLSSAHNFLNFHYWFMLQNGCPDFKQQEHLRTFC